MKQNIKTNKYHLFDIKIRNDKKFLKDVKNKRRLYSTLDHRIRSRVNA